jgi:hypothetical protein
MSEQLKKNASKKLISMVGIASASVFLSFPAFALISSNASDSNQRLNTYTSPIDSTTVSSENLLAQSGTGNEPTPSAPSGGSDTNQTPTPSTPSGGSNTTPTPSTPSGGSQTAPSTSQGRTTGGTGYSTDDGRLVKGGWICLNNPNPKCNS